MHVLCRVPSKVGQYVGIGAQVMKPQPELSLLHGKEFDLIKNQVPGESGDLGCDDDLRLENSQGALDLLLNRARV